MNKIIGLCLVLLMISQAFLWSLQPKPIITVDIKALTEEVMQLAMNRKLSAQEVEMLAKQYAAALEKGVQHFSQEFVVLTKQSVISEGLDKTDELRNFIADEIKEANRS